MKSQIFILLMILFFSISCKTKKEVIVTEPIPEPVKQTPLTDENKKNKMLIKEFTPEENAKISENDKQVLTQFAQEKADHTCKRQNLNKMIEEGEQIDYSELKVIDSMIGVIDYKVMKFSKEPSFKSYFENEFNVFIQKCN